MQYNHRDWQKQKENAFEIVKIASAVLLQTLVMLIATDDPQRMQEDKKKQGSNLLKIEKLLEIRKKKLNKRISRDRFESVSHCN